MTTDNLADRAATILMPAFKGLSSDSEAKPPDAMGGYGFRRAPSGTRFRTDGHVDKAVRGAFECIQPATGTYPANELESNVLDLVIAAKDAGVAIADAQATLALRLRELIARVTTLVPWCALHVVRGVHVEGQSFTLGRCTFYRMDKSAFVRWGQRVGTGRYNPPSTAGVSFDWSRQNAALQGQTVAEVRVQSSGLKHAELDGKAAIEETLDLIRYGQLTVDFPPTPVPELGLSVLGVTGFVEHHSVCVRMDGFGSGTNMMIPGTQGAQISLCSTSPAWNNLEAILKIPRNQRSELQRRIVLALAWVGQAALAAVDSVRLVAETIALEALLIQQSETRGKRGHLVDRIPRFPQLPTARRHVGGKEMDYLYTLRSDCVHCGQFEVPKSDERLANVAVCQVFSGLLDGPLATCLSLAEVLDRICPPVAPGNATCHICGGSGKCPKCSSA